MKQFFLFFKRILMENLLMTTGRVGLWYFQSCQVYLKTWFILLNTDASFYLFSS